MAEPSKQGKKNYQPKEIFDVFWPNGMVLTLPKQTGLGYEKVQFTTKCVKCSKVTTTSTKKICQPHDPYHDMLWCGSS